MGSSVLDLSVLQLLFVRGIHALPEFEVGGPVIATRSSIDDGGATTNIRVIASSRDESK